MKSLLPLVAAAILAFASPLYAQTASNPGSGSSGAGLGANTYTGPQTMPAGTTSAPSLNMPQGVAPTTPANGAKWSTSSGEFGQFGGQTYGPYGKFSITGTPTPGNCASFASATSLQDAGSPCGSSSSLNPALQPAFISGRWYLPAFAQVASGSGLTANRMVFVPFILLQPMTITDIGVRIISASSGTNVSEGIYASNGATGRPTGAPLLYTGSLSSATAADVDGPLSAGSGSNVTLAAGIYWYGTNADNSLVSCQAWAVPSIWMSSLFGSTSQNNLDSGPSTVGLAVYAAQTFGTWPNVTSTSWTEAATSLLACIPQFKEN
jgi:hypothetical protein